MKISRVRKVKLPTRGTEKSAGIDFYVPEFDEQFVTDLFDKNGEDIDVFEHYKQVRIPPHCRINIPSGVKVRVPEGFSLIAFNKSGVSSKKGLDVLACVIDEDYQGEVHLSFVNTSLHDIDIKEGDKIVQFLIIPVICDDVEEVELGELYEKESNRGEGGFGSTGG